MLATVGVLLPAIVVGAQTPGTITVGSHQIRARVGAWSNTILDGTSAVIHDGKKWAGQAGYPLVLFNTPSFSRGTVRIEFKLIDGTDDQTAGLVFGHTGRGPSYYFVRYNTKDGNVALWRMDGTTRTVVKHGEHHEQLNRDAWHRLELTLDGNKVLAVVDGGPLRVEHELDEPVSGGLGLWTKPEATTGFRNLVIGTPSHDSYTAEVMALGRGAPISKKTGVWTSQGDGAAVVFTHDGTKWAAKEGYPMAAFREPRNFGNGTVSIEFKLIDGGDDHTAGLVFGLDGESYHYVRYNTKDGNVALWRMEGPTRTVLKHGEAHEQLAKGEWHRIVLTVRGKNVRAVVNGRLSVDLELEEPVGGQLGMWTKPNATSAFRNLKVKS